MVSNIKQPDWYIKNRDREIQRMKKWRELNKDKVKQYRKEYQVKNRENILKHKKEYRQKNSDKLKEYNRREEVKQKQRERIALKRQLTGRKYDKTYYKKNIEQIKLRQKLHSQLPHVKARKAELARLRRKLNPQSNRSYPLELQFAMNRVRLRDGNKCKWQGCNITHKEDKIHVHHIFPRSEHPELELEERYMICYCSTHHRQFHRMRGDSYSEMIKPDINLTLELDSVSGRD